MLSFYFAYRFEHDPIYIFAFDNYYITIMKLVNITGNNNNYKVSLNFICPEEKQETPTKIILTLDLNFFIY